MVYRYKLAKTPKTFNMNAKVIQGIKLRKHLWLYCQEQINFGAMSDLVVEEFADSKEILIQNDKEDRKEKIDKQKEKGRQIIEYKKKSMKEIVSRLSREQLLAKTTFQLKRILHYLKFKKNEYVELDHSGLVDLILLEREVSSGEDKKDTKKDK